MNYENILTTTENSITTITINRPTKLNALNVVTINELHDAFKRAGENNDIKVIIKRRYYGEEKNKTFRKEKAKK